MKKMFLFILILCSIAYSERYIKNENLYSKEFIRIEVEDGPFHSIKFMEEGLICKTVDSNFKINVEFFPITKLSSKKIGYLENYLFSETLLLKDTIIDNQSVKVFGGSNGLKISLIKDGNLYNNYWIDGKCTYLEKCLFLINDLIPDDSRERFKIHSIQ